MSPPSTHEEWAQSLLGRDWEIFWSEENENEDDATTNGLASPPDINNASKAYKMDTETEGASSEKDEDEESQGSIIDDWYAGSVISFEKQANGRPLFKVDFVGDEAVYEMELDPKNVRPSASGWIKRTTALLCSPFSTDGAPWHAKLPPDTATPADRDSVRNLQTDLENNKFEPISLVDQKESVATPSMDDLRDVIRLQNLLKVQVFLRSRLAKIVNVHGSMKFIDGEPNPTEPLVNHLTECCNDLIHACEWYCKCWELLTMCFKQKSGESSKESASRDRSLIDFNKLIDYYLEFGKNCIVNCASMDTVSTSSKRRLLTPTANGPRRPKRRRRQPKFDEEPSFDIVADEGDLLSTVSVDHFVTRIQGDTHSWYLHVFGRMMTSVSHNIVDPLVQWRLKANLYLGKRNDFMGSGSKTDDDNGNPSDEEMDDVSDDEDRFYTFEDLESCVRALETNPVFSLLDLSEEESLLTKKLEVSRSMATKGIELLHRLADATPKIPVGDAERVEDEVQSGLKSILAAVESPNHSISNLEPIGPAGKCVTRELLGDAIEIRSWIVDVDHASSVRERTSFIEGLSERLQGLPSLPDTPVNLLSVVPRQEEAKSQVQVMTSQLSEGESALQSYRKELDQHKRHTTGLWSKEGLQRALENLKILPFVSQVEEEIAVRLDILEWKEQCPFDKPNNFGYAQLEQAHDSLQDILNGVSPTRSVTSDHVRADERVEAMIRASTRKDIENLCGPQVKMVTSGYRNASQWKERAETIISALRMHGNATAGDVRTALKLPAMVDIKRISDLVSEYKSLNVVVPGYTALLEAVQQDALNWSTSLEENVGHEEQSLEQCLVSLRENSERRPKGLILDPTRNALDCIIDLLEWHQRTKVALLHLKRAVRDGNPAAPESLQAERYSNGLVETAYPLLAEGVEVVELFSSERGDSFQGTAHDCIDTLEARFGIRRSARAISRDRIDGTSLGSKVLSRMVRANVDIEEGYPVFVMLWFLWHLSVANFVFQVEDEALSEKHKARNGQGPLSLTEAKSLRDQEPVLTKGESDSESDFTALVSTKTVELRDLGRLIQESEKAEADIRELLSRSREMRKGSIRKADDVRRHVGQLREAHTLVKNRAVGVGGLSLQKDLEVQLDHQCKIFTWLVRTLSYPLLHLDEASYSSSEIHSSGDLSRVPWDVLVSLCERIPPEVEERNDDFALLSLRIRELYDAAREWQDEISKSTMLSIRGGKRRAPPAAANDPAKSELDQEASTNLQMDKMKQLAENPILSKVIMPREGAVNGILQTSTQFEMQLHSFLAMDYEGMCPDRAAFPNNESLVGKKGEFILFRLTGSDLFESVQASIQELSLVAENVLAETPGKATFDWIKGAVTWIEELASTVTRDSPFEGTKGNTLFIPSKEARELLREAEETFLVFPDDLKQTLSQHGILVSTKKQDRSLRVVLKKDGAHHSVGGTVIRWCPILLECLRADVLKLGEWEKQLTRILSEFNTFFAETSNNPKNHENDLYCWYCFHQRVGALLADGMESLVIAPEVGLVSSFSKLLASLKNYLDKHSNADLNKKFSKKWFGESRSLLGDRFMLLESLMHRKLASNGRRPKSVATEEPPATFRDTCRNYLLRSLSKAAKTVGLSNMKDVFKVSDLESYCCTKAWEIENEMFDRFQEEYGGSRVSDEYRNKARSLRVSLEDKDNLSLCLQVLIGDIDATKLVGMAKEQLANQKTKKDRAKAEEIARGSSNLTPQISKGQAGQSEAGRTSAPVVKGNQAGSASTPRTTETVVSSGRADGTNESAQDCEPPTNVADVKEELGVAAKTAELDSAAVVATLAKTASKASRPPPPPSLASSFPQQSTDVLPSASGTSSRDRGTRVKNSVGQDRYRIDIVNLRLSFNAAFYLEDESKVGVAGFLPDSFSEKGRLKPDEFSRFLSDKVSRGKWMAIPLRLTTISEHDSKEYKKFYKQYESKGRIAMFTVDQGTKLFLVTPKFHSAAKGTGLISFAYKTSTYAVVLTKEVGVHMD